MTLEELIARLESAKGPDRELDARVHSAINSYEFWAWRDESEISLFYDRKCHGDNIRMAGNILRYTGSLDKALTLGRNDDEKRAILEVVGVNWNELYTLERCILFWCAQALRLRTTPNPSL